MSLPHTRVPCERLCSTLGRSVSVSDVGAPYERLCLMLWCSIGSSTPRVGVLLRALPLGGVYEGRGKELDHSGLWLRP